MKTIIRGQKTKLSDLGLGSAFNVTIDLPASGMSVDLSCFGLDAAGKLADDRYMIFFNQLASPEGAIRVNLSGSRAQFQLNLDALPAAIDKLVFTGAIDGSGTMRGIGSGAMVLGEAATFALSGADFQEEKAVMLGELYRKDGQWRFGAVGQGFNGGLSALLAHFGGTEAAAASTPAPAPAAAPTPAPAPKVSLSKVTLEKRGDKVSLAKGASRRGFGRIRVNLNWNRNPSGVQPEQKSGGLFGMLGGALRPKGANGVDLDLGCLYELADGTPGGVQALGDSWGSFDSRPFIKLDSDDRTGTSTNGENLFINGDQFDQIKRILVFTFIYQGVPNWAATDGVVTIEVPDNAPVEVRLDHGGAGGMCAIASIENRNGQLQVTKLVDYIVSDGKMSNHEAMDRKYGFGLRWARGSKG
ncbi:TerD family protein [Pseudoduganella albidiflava]|uniref:Tellurium resistance protein n=1 Tax=Pseudoduganella albidiflava TaxID=321983 RepID=A0A411WTT6_9BURK|nr:TerD family protein [Pseudoduganella albidiflava]QBH99896.1 tellurium resistance protein [Pseudoduganella albidiflava]GGY54682.1 tellurium resistance protein TerA [Pseudoduganella albidiflava]